MTLKTRVADPESDPQDPYVFVRPASGSGFVSTRYGSESVPAPDPSIIKQK
jgi:hypothetical protein